MTIHMPSPGVSEVYRDHLGRRSTATSSENSEQTKAIRSVSSVMNTRNRRGLNTDACGTPYSTCMGLDSALRTPTCSCRFSRKFLIPPRDSIPIRIAFHRVKQNGMVKRSEALEKSRYMTSVPVTFATTSLQLLFAIIRLVVQERRRQRHWCGAATSRSHSKRAPLHSVI